MDPYEILGVERGANENEIEEAYKDRVKEAHPDLGGSSEDFIEVKEAYESICEDNVDDMNLSRPGRLVYKYPARVNYVNYRDIKNSLEDPSIGEMRGYMDSDVDQSFVVQRGQSILQAAESNGLNWPYSCRGGACTNCVVRVIRGDISTPSCHILTDELLDQGYRLTCIGKPLSEEIDIVYNIRDKPELQDLLLPTRR